MKVKPLSRII